MFKIKFQLLTIIFFILISTSTFAQAKSSIDSPPISTPNESHNNLNKQKSVYQQYKVIPTKLIGQDRYSTAIEISKSGWYNSNYAILVNSIATYEALCASPLADEYNAPVLLTDKDKINSNTLSELKRLKTTNLILIGNENSISFAQENHLKSQGFSTQRISGNSTYDLAYNIGKILETKYINAGKHEIKIFIANGATGLSDAASVASVTGINDGIILYTDGKDPKQILQFLGNNIYNTYIIGGEYSISTYVESQIKSLGIDVKRIAGIDRKETNAKVINEFFPNTGLGDIYIAKDGMTDSSHLIDALALGSLASRNYSPILLTSGNLSLSQQQLLKDKKVYELTQVGGGVNTTPFYQALNILNSNSFLDSYREDITIQLDGTATLAQAKQLQLMINNIPVNIINNFVKDGYKVLLSSLDLREYVGYNLAFEPSGVISYSDKTIYLSNKNNNYWATHSLYHEFGHYLDYKLGKVYNLRPYKSKESKFIDIFSLEKDYFVVDTDHNLNYYKSSATEFFAQGFSEIMENPLRLKQSTINLYNYTNKCVYLLN